MKNLETTLGYTFKDDFILDTALTHKSYAIEAGHEQYNEKLEFLGDAVLQLTISQYLLENYPKDGEGNLSHRRARLVKEETLADIANQLELAGRIRFGKGEIINGGATRPRILSCTLEAIFGAIYTDGGFEVARSVILKIFEKTLELSRSEADFRQDYKTEAQEYVQRKYGLTPTYIVESEEGPSHNKLFKVALLIGSGLVARGEGKSKKVAEQNAARQLLEEKK